MDLDNEDEVNFILEKNLIDFDIRIKPASVTAIVWDDWTEGLSNASDICWYLKKMGIEKKKVLEEVKRIDEANQFQKYPSPLREIRRARQEEYDV
ncbi:hypothetical protein [Lactobacillus sp.]|uniref:hypothetical protein n=1 Tax=Lactobacillus sp. TaxID=1591 RepID=UPI0019C0C57F|nr:hypothetical protein [Lactobacillus sp.]MBD5429319.1 hypothetical protein [Lactobacillus sp.]